MASTPVSELSSLTQGRRPKRADARRNYDALVETARTLFTEQGTEASLEDIARHAGVGIGTLYRNFASRQELLEVVYLDEVEALCAADDLTELAPGQALEMWLRRFLTYGVTKKALWSELAATIGIESDLFAACHQAIRTSFGPVFAAAQAAGVLRPDISPTDVLRLVGGIAVNTAGVTDDEMAERLLRVILDGLRVHSD